MADVLHVCAYLVCAASLKDALHQSDISEAFQHAVVGDGALPYL